MILRPLYLRRAKNSKIYLPLTKKIPPHQIELLSLYGEMTYLSRRCEAMHTKEIRNVHILNNSFANDNRVYKELESLSKHTHLQISLIARGDWKLPIQDQLPNKVQIERVNLVSDKYFKGKLKTLFNIIEWHTRVYLKLKKLNPEIIHAHDVFPLISALLYSITSRTKIIYDSHEFQTEMKNVNNWRKFVYRFFEKIASLKSSAVITVSRPIKDNYDYLYQFQRSVLVMNCPFSFNGNKNDFFRTKFNLKRTDVIYLYQGALTTGRGIEQIIDAFTKTEEDNHIIFMGFGPLAKLIISHAESNPHIHYHDAVPPGVLLQYTSSADVGITITDYSCKNHLMSLPNKFFEYIQAGIPVIATNLFEINRIIAKEKIGLVINDISSLELRNAITKMKDSHQLFTKNLATMKDKYIWEEEEKKLIKLYQQIAEGEI